MGDDGLSNQLAAPPFIPMCLLTGTPLLACQLPRQRSAFAALGLARAAARLGPPSGRAAAPTTADRRPSLDLYRSGGATCPRRGRPAGPVCDGSALRAGRAPAAARNARAERDAAGTPRPIGSQPAVRELWLSFCGIGGILSGR